ncbi:MAG: hypothetical protein H6867_05455 [Rhodospirillales bacterium]|nr:hypothetical protein [Rhodospirillales bacterium]MCB9994976.1 hypothetical protein [Rhodospirillales bacterium]
MSTIFNIASWAAVGIGALSFIGSGLYTIKQEHQGLVTRFGRHVRTNETPGLKFKIPFIESVDKISLKEYQVGENLETKTTDNLFAQLPIAIHYQVSDPAIFHFKKGDAVELMKKVVSAAVREYTSGKTFQELYDERQQIKEGVKDKVEEQVSGFGLQINDIIIDEPKASDQVKSDFDRVRSSELKKDAAKFDAEADYIRKVKSAEADRDRDLLRGEGAAGYRQRIFSQYAEQIDSLVQKGTPREEAVHVMMEVMKYDTWREASDKGNAFFFSESNGTGTDMAKRLKDFAPLNAALNGKEQVKEQDNKGPAAPSAPAVG